MALVQKLATQDSFDARGVFVNAGHIGTFDDEKISGKEKNIVDVGDFQTAMVEMAAIAPTGPNPTIPQQIPPDAVQDSAGTYALPGKKLVAEVTNPADQRIDQPGLRDPDAEAQVDATLADVMDTSTTNAASVDGSVADITANLGAQTNDQLRATLAAEQAGKNRKGVTSAIQAELDSRSQ